MCSKYREYTLDVYKMTSIVTEVSFVGGRGELGMTCCCCCCCVVCGSMMHRRLEQRL